MNVTLAATESFNQRNANTSLEEARAASVRDGRASGRRRPLSRSASPSAARSRGRVDPAVVSELVAHFRTLGAEEIVLADTIGVATPRQVQVTARGHEGRRLPRAQHAEHRLRERASPRSRPVRPSLDASIGGLGGCPFAPRATGNIATEDLVYMLEGDGVETGVDLDALIEISDWLESVLGRRLEGQVYRAGDSPASRTSRST